MSNEVLRSTGWAAPRPRLTLGILLGLCVLAFLDRQIISLLVGPIRHDLGISDFQLSLLQGLAFAAFYATCGLPLGWLVDRYSRRWVVWGAVTVWSLATIGSGLARTFGGLFVARFGVGAGEAGLTPAAYSMITDLFPRHRLAFVLSLYATGATLGASAALLLGGLLIGALGDLSLSLPIIGHVSAWQLIFICLGLPGLALAPVIFAVAEPRRTGGTTTTADSGDAADYRAFLARRRRLFSCHFIGFGLISMLGYGYLAWLPAYLMRHFGLTTAQAAGSLGLLVTACGIPGGVVSGWLVDRQFRNGRTDAHLYYWIWASLAIALSSIAAFSATNLWVFFLFAALVQTLAPFSGVAAAVVQLTTPERFRGRTSALFVLVFNLCGLGLGSSTIAAFTDFVFHDDAKVGYSIATAAAVLAPIAAVLFAFARAPMRSAIATPEI